MFRRGEKAADHYGVVDHSECSDKTVVGVEAEHGVLAVDAAVGADEKSACVCAAEIYFAEDRFLLALRSGFRGAFFRRLSARLFGFGDFLSCRAGGTFCRAETVGARLFGFCKTLAAKTLDLRE